MSLTRYLRVCHDVITTETEEGRIMVFLLNLHPLNKILYNLMLFKGYPGGVNTFVRVTTTRNGQFNGVSKNEEHI